MGVIIRVIFANGQVPRYLSACSNTQILKDSPDEYEPMSKKKSVKHYDFTDFNRYFTTADLDKLKHLYPQFDSCPCDF
jgi:hypothetical protein